MSSEEEYYRNFLLYKFCRGNSLTKAAKNIWPAYGDVFRVGKCQHLYNKFCSGNFDLENCSCFGRPSGVDNDVLKTHHISDAHLTTEKFLKNNVF